MGNREDLLEGARKVILERGLAKVTARDIAAAAGVSLAAIGYHFGSKDRLLSEAITEGMGAPIGDDFDAAIRTAGEGHSLWESLGPTVNGLIDMLDRNHDRLLLMLENGMRTVRSPDAQAYMSEATEGAYSGVAQTLREVYPDLAAADARAVAKLYFLLFQGFAIMWLLAPAGELIDGDEMERAVRVLREH